MAQSETSYLSLPLSERKPRAGAKLVKKADPQEQLTVSIRVRRKLGAPSLPDPTLAANVPHGHRQYLSREEFAKMFGASEMDMEQVAQFGRAHGLSVVETSAARRTVVLKGTVQQMSSAFAVELDMYQTDSETYRGRQGAVQIPTELASIVEGVFGLDNRQMARPLFQQKEVPATPAADGPAQATVPLTPPQVAKLYNFPTSPNASGQTIGLLEFGGGFNSSDIQLFYNSVGVAMPTISSISVDSQPNNPADGAATEVILDIDVAGSAAPGAKIAVYFAPWTEQGWVDAVTTAIHDTTHKPSVISISWGWPELNTIDGLTWTSAAMNAVSTTFAEAAAMGVTVFVSSGDHGSDCGLNDKKAHVLYPGSDPYITSCGGTSISNVSGTTFTEHVWNDNDNNWITGGGISDYFAPPVWQAYAGTPVSANGGNHRGRAIPDVAGNADGASGYNLFQNGRNIGSVGGTSATAPLYAGLVALLNAGLGEPVGYLNPLLYGMPYGYVYRDINDGISNARGGAPGYKSGPGFDCCTGLGVLNGVALENALRGTGLPMAMATFNNRLYMVWKGIERDDRVFFSYYNGQTWVPQQMIAGIGSSSGVSLAVYGNKLYMAWKGILGDQGIYYSSFDGNTWAAQKEVAGIGSSVGPRLAVLGNNLFMAWKGVENDQRIFFNQFNGSTWTAQQVVPGVATSVGPAVVNLNGSIYMAWKGMNGDQGIYWSKFNGTSFAAQQVIPGVGTSEGPSLAIYNGVMYAAWKGIFGDQTMWYSTFNGTSWVAQKEIPNVWSSVGLGLAAFNGQLYAAWKGMNGDQTIWFTHFNGSTWAAQVQIAGIANSPDLVEAGAGER